jgi:predicted Zn-dependent protease
MVRVLVSHSGISNEQLRHVVSALQEFTHETGIKLETEFFLGERQVKDLDAREEERFNAKRKQLDAGSMMDFFGADGRTKDGLWLHITKRDLYGEGTNFVLGGSKGHATVYSVKQFEEAGKALKKADYDPEQAWEAFKHAVKHEMGHSFEAVTKGSEQTVESLGTHCANTCTMKQVKNMTEALVRANSLRGVNDFCPRCVRSMREYVRNRFGERHLTPPKRV